MKSGERIVYGAGPVRELVRSRPRAIVKLLASKPGPITDAAVSAGVAVVQASKPELDRMAGEGAVHQGLVAVTGPYEYTDVDDILSAAVEGDRPALIIAVDSVSDPHNLGAIVRSAYLAGAHGVIIPRDRAAQIGAVATKASAGATEHIPIAQVTNLARTLDDMKAAGLWRVALHSAETAVPLWKLDATLPLCLILGAEGSGIRPLVARQCDFAAIIPMQGRAVGSYNVSVAAGIALYEITRQRDAAV